MVAIDALRMKQGSPDQFSQALLARELNTRPAGGSTSSDSGWTGEAGSDGRQAEVIVTPSLELTGHLQRVIEVAWAPHDARLLCSVSYDWSAQVGPHSSGAL